MINSIAKVLTKLWKRFPWVKSDERSIDTLTAFVRDSEHDVLSVVTALQAHLDLLHNEQERNHISVSRFAVLDRAVARIIADMTVLAAISEQVLIPKSRQKQMLDGLIKEIAQETQADFSESQVSLSCNIAAGTTLIGNADALKVMIRGMLLAVLRKSHEFETVKIVGFTDQKRVSLSIGTGLNNNDGTFKPWKLGELHTAPTNGEGINLAAVDAMARLHDGQLTVTSTPGERRGYRLIFQV